MAKKKRKRVLNAALKALLAGAETAAAIKIPAAFISELADLPDDKQKVLAELSQEQFNALLTQSELATLNAAEAAAGTKQIKALIKELTAKVDQLTTRGEPEERVIHIQNLPYPSIGDLFKGRADILDRLKARFDENRPTAITQAIEGLGGIGKTRLAIEFGWWVWANNKAPAVLFASAETPEKLDASLAALAAEDVLGLGGEKQAEQLGAVFSWLNENPGWLMILDNADTEEAAKAVEDLLARLANGRVIITSRYKRWGGSVSPCSLELLEAEQAIQFMLERTAGRRIDTPEDQQIAGQLVEELGYLPLALEQAAAYIANNQCSLADYQGQWASERQKVLEWYDERQMQYPASVAVTWQRTFKQLGPASRTLLNLLAFLAPEMIPSTMFKKSSDIVKEAVELLTGKKPAKKAKLKIDDVLAELAAYSMITRQQEGFTVHRIVQEVIRSRIAEQSRRAWIEKALNIVNHFAPRGAADVRTWPIYDILRPHAELIAQIADKAQITEPTARLMNQLALYLKTKGLYDRAEPMYRRALKIDEASFGPDHPKVAIRLNNLAELLRATNRYPEAEPLYRRALEIDEASFGPDHPNVARDLNNLAQLLQDTNRLSEAEPLMRRALKIDEASFGPDHPDVATDLNNLAGLLRATDRLDEAEPMYRRALKMDEASFGPDHPEVATDLNNLAQLLQSSDRLDEAEPMYRRVVEIFEKSLGENHPNVATALNNLAELLSATNRLSEAEPMYRRALKIFEDSLGPNHPSTKTVRENLKGLK